jgi:hypothetical protein
MDSPLPYLYIWSQSWNQLYTENFNRPPCLFYSLLGRQIPIIQKILCSHAYFVINGSYLVESFLKLLPARKRVYIKQRKGLIVTLYFKRFETSETYLRKSSKVKLTWEYRQCRGNKIDVHSLALGRDLLKPPNK